MVEWTLGILTAVIWIGSFTWYFEGDIRNWLRKRYWWQRTLRMLRK